MLPKTEGKTKMGTNVVSGSYRLATRVEHSGKETAGRLVSWVRKHVRLKESVAASRCHSPSAATGVSPDHSPCISKAGGLFWLSEVVLILPPLPVGWGTLHVVPSPPTTLSESQCGRGAASSSPQARKEEIQSTVWWHGVGLLSVHAQ